MQKAHILTAKTIGALYATRTIRAASRAAAIAVAVLFAATTYVTLSVSGWWAIFYIPVVLVGALLFVIWLLLQSGIKAVTGAISKEQREATEQFIDKMQQLAEDLQTPPPVILYRVLKDVILRRDQQFLLDVTSRSVSLKPDFEALSKLFHPGSF